MVKNSQDSGMSPDKASDFLKTNSSQQGTAANKPPLVDKEPKPEKEITDFRSISQNSK